ncbi:MAG: hypothetical protein HUU57_05975 [Bdellovibrio sp.]|nr:hypothetical protein [Bdellovibrio sp.]
MNKLLSIGLVVGFFLGPSVWAQSNVNAYEVPQVAAVESKLFVPQRDLAVHLGVLPLDAFYKALTLGLSYTTQFQSYLGWEIINANAAFTPIYSKSLFFNKDVLHSETSFVLGGGMVAFNSGESAPMFGGGAIFRVYKSRKFSYKFDGRLYYTSAAGKSSNFLLDLSVGLAFEFGDEVKKDAI